MAVILCGPVSAMYSYSSGTYDLGIYTPDTPTMITPEDWDNILGDGGSSDPLQYVGQLPSRSKDNGIQDSSDSTSSDSSQVTSTESSATPKSSPSPESSTGAAVNNT